MASPPAQWIHRRVVADLLALLGQGLALGGDLDPSHDLFEGAAVGGLPGEWA